MTLEQFKIAVQNFNDAKLKQIEEYQMIIDMFDNPNHPWHNDVQLIKYKWGTESQCFACLLVDRETKIRLKDFDSDEIQRYPSRIESIRRRLLPLDNLEEVYNKVKSYNEAIAAAHLIIDDCENFAHLYESEDNDHNPTPTGSSLSRAISVARDALTRDIQAADV